MLNWWSWLREKFIVNELFHQPDEYILCQFLREYQTAASTEKNKWLHILSSACLVRTNGAPITLSPQKIKFPYRGDCRFASRYTYTPNDTDQLKAAITKLSQYRSYFNQGRMGEPPLVSLKYIQAVGRDFVRPFASWSNSSSPRTPEQIYDYVINKNARDPRVLGDKWDPSTLKTPDLNSGIYCGELYDILARYVSSH